MSVHRTLLKFSAFAAATGLIGLTSASAGAATFTEGNLSGNNWSDTWGQAFVVGLEPNPDPGLLVGDPVKLEQFQTFRAGAGFGDPNADVYLAITEGAFFDWDGDPNGSFTPTVTDMLAISSNSFNPSTLAAGDPMAFTFGAGVDVLYGSAYAATYVTIDAGNNVTPVQVGSLLVEWALDELLGIWLPVQDYGAQDNFDAAALFADDPAAPDGFMTACEFACDMNFQATLSTGGGLEGDLNGDGFVGIADLNIVLGDWNQTVPPADPAADPTGDNFVGIADLNTVLGNWNAGTPPAVGSAVPEPASAVTLLIAGTIVTGLRRRA